MASLVVVATKRLRANFPLCFCWPPKPIMVGATEAACRTLYPNGGWGTPQWESIATAIKAWTSTPEYLHACTIVGAMRVDLQGNAVEPVSTEDARYAHMAFRG